MQCWTHRRRGESCSGNCGTSNCQRTWQLLYCDFGSFLKTAGTEFTILTYVTMSLMTVILLLICTCTYIRAIVPSLLDNQLGKVGFQGTFWKCARIGERKSPYVAFGCLFMAFNLLFWS